MIFSASLTQKIITFLTSLATIAIPPVVTVYLVKNEKLASMAEEVSKSKSEIGFESLEKPTEIKKEEPKVTEKSLQPEQKPEENKENNESVPQSKPSEVSESQDDTDETKTKDIISKSTQKPSISSPGAPEVTSPSIPVKLSIPAELNLDGFSKDDLITLISLLGSLLEQ